MEGVKGERKKKESENAIIIRREVLCVELNLGTLRHALPVSEVVIHIR